MWRAGVAGCWAVVKASFQAGTGLVNFAHRELCPGKSGLRLTHVETGIRFIFLKNKRAAPQFVLALRLLYFPA